MQLYKNAYLYARVFGLFLLTTLFSSVCGDQFNEIGFLCKFFLFCFVLVVVVLFFKETALYPMVIQVQACMPEYSLRLLQKSQENKIKKWTGICERKKFKYFHKVTQK